MSICHFSTLYFHKLGRRDHFYFELSLLDDRAKKKKKNMQISCGWLRLYLDSVVFEGSSEVKPRGFIKYFMPTTDFELI